MFPVYQDARPASRSSRVPLSCGSLASEPAPWDIGRPQAAFVRLADKGLLHGRLLDSGCGTGEQTLLAAIQRIKRA